MGDDRAPSTDAGADSRDAAAPPDVERRDDAPGADDVGVEANEGDDAAVCQPVPEDRRACRPPLDTSICPPGSWDDLPPLPCGLRVYQGPVGDYLAYYVSFADIPPLGGPSSICIYDTATHAIVGAWSVGDYLQYCCQSSLDIYQGIVTDAMIDEAYRMSTHLPCEDDDAGDGGD